MCGGDLGRMRLAWRAFAGVARDPALAAKIGALGQSKEPPKVSAPKVSVEPLRLLAILQREGRLIDLLTEDIGAAAPEQIAAAVRAVLPKCQAVLQKHLALEPVIAESEGNEVVVPAGFDPSAIRLIGNVTGQPPFRGTLLHSGWRAKDLRIPVPAEGQDEMVLMPAEVEVK
jgi:hypothetical protein